ncbi:hypothetical protein JTB14_030050 [Gonioctena quinquepunctata]|nr:hypothetical protein JTB14_030050 [Gonioctena quinquepunctata]
MENYKEELENQIQASEVRLSLLNGELKFQVRSLKEENSELKHRNDGTGVPVEFVLAELNKHLKTNKNIHDINNIYPLEKADRCPAKIEFEKTRNTSEH